MMRPVRASALMALLLAFSLAGCTASNRPATPDGKLFLTIDLQVQPHSMDEFLAVMIPAARDTRAWDGCLLFDIYVDQNMPGHVVFYEIWDSKAQQQAYLAWRQQTNFNAQIAPFMAEGGGGLTYFDKVDG
ncbi:MAG: putative quinol monooxygenase [Pseudomonadales bacterium]